MNRFRTRQNSLAVVQEAYPSAFGKPPLARRCIDIPSAGKLPARSEMNQPTHRLSIALQEFIRRSSVCQVAPGHAAHIKPLKGDVGLQMCGSVEPPALLCRHSRASEMRPYVLPCLCLQPRRCSAGNSDPRANICQSEVRRIHGAEFIYSPVHCTTARLIQTGL